MFPLKPTVKLYHSSIAGDQTRPVRVLGHDITVMQCVKWMGQKQQKQELNSLLNCSSIISPSRVCFCNEVLRATVNVAACLILCPWKYNWRQEGTLLRDYGSEVLFLKLSRDSCLISNFPNTLTKWPADESLGMRGCSWSSWLRSKNKGSQLPSCQLICGFSLFLLIEI